MANQINVSTTTNTVTITPQDATNVNVGTTNTSVNVTQGSTSVVQVTTQGPRGEKGADGAQGLQGIPGSLTAFEDVKITGSLIVSGAGHITASGNISASGTITGNSSTLGSLTLGGNINMDGNTLSMNTGEITDATSVRSLQFGSPTDQDLIITSDGNITFKIDDDNDETGQSFKFQNNNTEIANLDESGNLQLDGHITASGNISSSATGSFAQLSLSNLPTSDPGIIGVLFTTQSTGTGGNLDGQKILLVSQG